jgi:prepilin-type N-terminal cleavage/methylation domain-containing protein
MHLTCHQAPRHDRTVSSGEAGYTLIEMIVAMAILMVVTSVVMRGVADISQLNTTVTNRSDMFAAVRNASALLQQEVGQAGRVTLPGNVTLTGAVGAGFSSVAVSSTAAMFNGEFLDVGTGDNREVVAVTVDTGAGTIGATFANAHAANEPVSVSGGFAAGVVPPGGNGSSGFVLKVFGDINGNGNMVYVEYTCDIGGGRLTRNSMAFNAGAKTAPGVEEILVDNLVANPGNAPCFTYQPKTVTGVTYIIGVAITLTVQSRERDPITGQFQRESKALLNVSPRNVFNVWQNASLGLNNRVQPTPASVTNLLPPLP